MKTHMFRSTRSTWCGRTITSKTTTYGTVPMSRVTTNDRAVTCKVCQTADAAEQRNQT